MAARRSIYVYGQLYRTAAQGRLQASGRNDIEVDSEVVSDSEDSDDCIMEDIFDVPLDLITDSADLSRHRGPVATGSEKHRTTRIANNRFHPQTIVELDTVLYLEMLPCQPSPTLRPRPWRH